MSEPHYRVIVHLKAKPSQEQTALDLCLEVAPAIRQVDGLYRLEINRVIDDPARLVLYYWWSSPAHAQRYVEGALFASLMPRLIALIDEHSILMTENVSG